MIDGYRGIGTSFQLLFYLERSILILVLMFRPSGLLGRPEVEKV